MSELSDEISELVDGYRQSWWSDAACKGLDQSIFFPERGQNSREAKKICARCDVRTECLAYALENKESFGVWGGVTEKDRRKLRKQIDIDREISDE